MSRLLFTMPPAQRSRDGLHHDRTTRCRQGVVVRSICCIPVIALLLISTLCKSQQATKEEDGVWAREQAYWRAVQTNNLQDYRALWRDDFLGWPSTSADPARKAHITDWITAYTSKGEHLKSYALERLSVQVSGDMATTTYRARSTWVTRDGAEQSGVMRILHTWRREPDGRWLIFSGMSAPVNADGK